MYPSMYQVMYVEKNFSYFCFFENFGISLYRSSRCVVVRSTKLVPLKNKNERLRQTPDRQTTEGSNLKQSLTNRRFY